MMQGKDRRSYGWKLVLSPGNCETMSDIYWEHFVHVRKGTGDQAGGPKKKGAQGFEGGPTGMED